MPFPSLGPSYGYLPFHFRLGTDIRKVVGGGGGEKAKNMYVRYACLVPRFYLLPTPEGLREERTTTANVNYIQNFTTLAPDGLNQHFAFL